MKFSSDVCFSRWAAVTPADGSDVAKVAGRGPRALWVGGTGTVAITNEAGDSETFSGVPAGTLLPFEGIKRVLSTGTTATLIIALYW